MRHASLNSAISRGIRRSLPKTPGRVLDTNHDRRRPEREESRPRRSAHSGYLKQKPGFAESTMGRGNRRPPPFARTSGKTSDPSNDGRGSWHKGPRRDDGRDERRDERQARPVIDDRRRETKRNSRGFDEDEFIRSGNFRGLPREHRSHGQSKSTRMNHVEPVRAEKRKAPSIKPRHHRATDAAPERVKENVKVPDSVPYTTPASEFIYGSSPVLSALRCSRRQLYKLYIYQPPSKDELSPNQIILRKLAHSKNIEVKVVFAGWDRLLDKMSSGWPHQNCVLEASPLPKLPMRNFQAYTDMTKDHFQFELAPQSREEAAVNGTNDRVEIHRGHQFTTRRYPVALLVDGIVDPGNLGAILRSAYFLGVDAVVFAGRNNAPLSPVTIKASCGAAENMALLHVRNEVEFIKRSKENGWRFYAADAPGAGATYLNQLSPEGDSSNHRRLAEQSPCVLMMGSEATGLSAHIKSHADAVVSIPGARHSVELGVESDPARVDSLNVSVAAALLMQTFMQTPLAVSGHTKSQDKMW